MVADVISEGAPNPLDGIHPCLISPRTDWVQTLGWILLVPAVAAVALMMKLVVVHVGLHA